MGTGRVLRHMGTAMVAGHIWAPEGGLGIYGHQQGVWPHMGSAMVPGHMGLGRVSGHI